MAANISVLEKKANFIRGQILETIAGAGEGHIGGSFSCTEILVALYYGNILRYNPKAPGWESRDRFILSKGHGGAALYAILADLGFFPSSELNNFCKNGGMLAGLPNRNIPGIEADTGSLGHGLGIAAGLSLSDKINEKGTMNVVLLGDGECYEGSVWESAMFAAHHKLGNLVAIIDRNHQCVTDFTKDCLDLEPLAAKWEANNWEVREINGHSFAGLLDAFRDFRDRCSKTPLMVIADTIKGKGVSFMERGLEWHHRVPSGEKLKTARRELGLTDK